MNASLAPVTAAPVAFAERFYLRLFECAPHLKRLFPADLTVQTERLAAALTAALDTATSAPPAKIGAFETALAQMGARHATHYRVQAEYYPLIGEALVRAARDVAGHTWSSQTSSAWVAVYEWLAGHMIRGAAVAGDTSIIPASLHRAVQAAAATAGSQRIHRPAPSSAAGATPTASAFSAPTVPLPPLAPATPLPLLVAGGRR